MFYPTRATFRYGTPVLVFSAPLLERSLLLFKAIPGAELHIFDQAAHWVQWDQAERFNTIVRDFLRS